MQLNTDNLIQGHHYEKLGKSKAPVTLSYLLMDIHRKGKQWNVSSLKMHRYHGNLCQIQNLPRHGQNLDGSWAKCKCYCIWLYKHDVFCTRAICWEWITAAKYIVPPCFMHSYDKLKQAGNRRVNNYLTNTPLWSDRIHKQPISLCSLVFPACWRYSPPQMLFLEKPKTVGEARALHYSHTEQVLCRTR